FLRTESKRAQFPLRGLVPEKVEGLVGSFLNIGQSSIISSAVRWHCTMPGVGQASAALAAVALKHGVQPKDVARDWRLIRGVQKSLVTPFGGAPGLALIAYQDLSPDIDRDRLFASVNFLGVRGIFLPRPGSLDFQPHEIVSRREAAAIVARAIRSTEGSKPYL